MRLFRISVLSVIAMVAMVAVSCKEDSIEGPFGGQVIHEQSGITSASVSFSDGKVNSTGAYTVKPEASVETGGTCEFPLYIIWSLDGGEQVKQGPFAAGEQVKYDLGSTPLAPGRHTVVGEIGYDNALGNWQKVKPFADEFNIDLDYVPDFQFYVVREGVETPIYTFIPVVLDSNTSYRLAAKAKSLVTFNTLNYPTAYMEFSLVSRVEEQGCSYVPFTTKGAGSTVLTANITINGTKYSPVFTFITKEK